MDFASDRYDASSAADYDANLDANNQLCDPRLKLRYPILRLVRHP